MRQLDETALEQIAAGAAVLGTGGGGDPQLGLLIARQAIREYGPVDLVGVDEVDPDSLVVPVSMMGAPAVAKEKLPSVHPLDPILESLIRAHGKAPSHVMPAEIGGIAALIPVAAAARWGVPMLDADLMGRAFPQLPMLLSSIHGVPVSPVVMADEWGSSVEVRGVDDHHAERLARTVCVEMGASALMALAAVVVPELRSVAVAGSVSLAQNLGRVLHEARAAHADPVEALLGELGGVRLLDGKVTDVDARTSGGFTRLAATVEGIGAFEGRVLTVRSQNEHLVAMSGTGGGADMELRASTPDLIMVLDTTSGDAVTTEQLRFGARVSVVAARCDERYRAPIALDVVGPRAFGYDFDYVPLEQLAAGREAPVSG